MKCGIVAVVGRPNVGKSTLVNALCEDKVAITSAVPNTTRRRIFGVATGDDWQLVLADLPGFQRPMDALTARMQETVDGSFEGVDAVALVVSARDRIGAGDRFVARRVFGLDVPVVIVVNKIDRLKHGHVASQMRAASALGGFHALHPVSAKTKDGIGELRADLVSLLPDGAPLFPPTQTTDLPLPTRVAEVIREKALQLTREEVPHAVAVVVDEIDAHVVRARLLVESESQKGILVGKRGLMIREIGSRARREVVALIGHPVYLELAVKVRPRWRRDRAELDRLDL
jgi:GTP-binding protein Era